MYNPFSLKNKTILVTGASSGIGKSIAIECSRMGAIVILTARNEERLKETYELLDGEGHSIIVADLSKEEDCNKLVENTPSLDGLVLAAGVNILLPFKFVNREKIESLFEVNFLAPTLLSQKLLKKKKISDNSSIVTLCSIDGPITSHPAHSIYSSSKGALLAMTKSMAIDLAPRKIRVNAILPGMTETPLINLEGLTDEQVIKHKNEYPLHRYANPEEIAYGAIYLLSDASSFTTGSSLVIDGGFTLI